jgi:BCD family chlorophyll transporter-like MFS transporter
MTVTVLALWGIEQRSQTQAATKRGDGSFWAAAGETWRDLEARRFAVFIFVSMVAYNTQDLILEPFGGHVFEMTPGQSTALGGKLHAGALIGMLLVFAAGLSRALGGPVIGSSRAFVAGGCIGSGLCLMVLALGGTMGPGWPVGVNVMALGFCNGVFAVAAIGAMMALASQGGSGREGTRMGVFGAAQSIGFALGASAGAASLDLLRATLGVLGEAYALVFLAEGLMFLAAALLASRLRLSVAPRPDAASFAG